MVKSLLLGKKKAVEKNSRIVLTIDDLDENEVQVVPKKGKTSSWKRFKEYRINKPSQQFKRKKKMLCMIYLV
jgi:hypothetical protein